MTISTRNKGSSKSSNNISLTFETPTCLEALEDSTRCRELIKSSEFEKPTISIIKVMNENKFIYVLSTFSAPDQVTGLRIVDERKTHSNFDFSITWNRPKYPPDNYTVEIVTPDDSNSYVITVPGVSDL